ncbi:MAG: phage tail protein [Rhizobiaceae bacterium]|nr:phage tail protein [Rhizobiaceae bacterium]
MSVFTPVGALISIGGAVLYTVGGLNPQRIRKSSESRVPGHPVQGGMEYQKTGMGERAVTIEARTLPQIMGGLDAYAILEAQHEMQAEVPFIRLHGNYLGISGGLVIVRSLDADEEQLHPFDGVGRIVDVTMDLLQLPGLGGIAIPDLRTLLR